MDKKKTRGMTLVELILALALLAVVTAAAGGALLAAARAYSLNTKLQDDEYNARLALLSITRQAHRGASGVVIDTVDGISELTLTSLGGDVIRFALNGGILTRTVLGGDTPVGFVPVELRGFQAESTGEGRWLTIRVTCTNGMELTTKVSLARIPAA